MWNRGEAEDSPSCFVEEEETGIPALSRWILELAAPAREKAADELFAGLQRLITSVLEYVEGIPGVTIEDRDTLRNTWKSKETQLFRRNVPEPTSRQLRKARYASCQTSVIYRLLEVSIRNLL